MYIPTDLIRPIFYTIFDKVHLFDSKHLIPLINSYMTRNNKTDESCILYEILYDFTGLENLHNIVDIIQSYTIPNLGIWNDRNTSLLLEIRKEYTNNPIDDCQVYFNTDNESIQKNISVSYILPYNRVVFEIKNKEEWILIYYNSKDIHRSYVRIYRHLKNDIDVCYYYDNQVFKIKMI